MHICRRTIALIAGIALSLIAQQARAGDKIALLISHEDVPFREATAGFHEYLNSQGVQAGYELYTLEGDAAKANQAVQKIKKAGANLILALGSLAADTAAREISDIPIVAGLVLRADTIKKGANVTGVGLEFPVDLQFKWLQTFLPNAKTIGVVFNPDENKSKIDSASKIAQKKGLRLEAHEARTAQDVPSALEKLSKKADVLWLAADKTVISPQTAKPLLIFSFQNSIPVIGPASTWVKAGALYSLDGDYKDVGAQCGEMAVRILKGAQAGDIPPSPPRKVAYTLNMNTARQMRISIPDDLVRGAKQVF